ncbi:MAG: aspartate aminotransferase family protein [Pseudomonadota bacterium]
MMPALLPTYARAPIAFSHGEGCWLVDTHGERYLDFAAGIAVNVLGHAHPALVRALTEQAQRLWHVSNLYEIPAQRELAERLVDLTFADTVFFANSGTECCELAVKMVRRHWFEQGDAQRREIIAFEGAFHGRSAAAIAAAGSTKLTHGFAPLLPGFRQLPFADHEALRAAIGPQTAAVMVEPVQGEGGIRPLSEECLHGLREACDAHGVLLVLDEVQCGVGRTGSLFAHERARIVPDIMMVAKGIGGGFPLGALLARERASKCMTLGAHGSTYGGNPLGCAVGKAVLDIVSTPAFLAHVREAGERARGLLQELVAAYPEVFAEVRGVGLMLGLRCAEGISNAQVVAAAAKAGVLTVPAGENVIRIVPPLTISDAELAIGAERLGTVAQRYQLEPVG